MQRARNPRKKTLTPVEPELSQRDRSHNALRRPESLSALRSLIASLQIPADRHAGVRSDDFLEEQAKTLHGALGFAVMNDHTPCALPARDQTRAQLKEVEVRAAALIKALDACHPAVIGILEQNFDGFFPDKPTMHQLDSPELELLVRGNARAFSRRWKLSAHDAERLALIRAGIAFGTKSKRTTLADVRTGTRQLKKAASRTRAVDVQHAPPWTPGDGYDHTGAAKRLPREVVDIARQFYEALTGCAPEPRQTGAFVGFVGGIYIVMDLDADPAYFVRSELGGP